MRKLSPIIIAAILLICNSGTLNAQAPDVQVSPKKHILNIGQTLQASPNKKGKFGYVDTKGKYYIKPVFDEVTDFKKIFTDDWSYLASVKHGGKWRLIKDNGEYFPNPHVEFDTKPIFLGDIYVLCEYNDKLYKHWLISWGNPVCYDEKIIFEDKTVYLQNKENNKEGLIIKSNGRIQNLNDCCLNAIDDCHIINSGGFVLVDKNFNEITERYDYMQGNGQTVMAMNRDGEGIVYRNGIIYSFKLEAPKIDCTLHVQYIIGREKLLTMITTPEQNNNDNNNIKTVTTLKRVGVNLFEIHKEGKYGLIDISGNLSIPIIHDHSIFDSFGRYKTNTDDVIVMNNTMYSISDYDNLISKKIRSLNHLNTEVRYDIMAQEYLSDSLLTMDEKKYYKEIVQKIEEWSDGVSSFDDIIFNEHTPQFYISTTAIPEAFKKHLAEAQRNINKMESLWKPNRNLTLNKTSYSGKGREWAETEEYNGNFYTHRMYESKGFVFRDNAITKKTEIYFDDVCVPISESREYFDYAKIAGAKLPNNNILHIYSTFHRAIPKGGRHDINNSILMYRIYNNNEYSNECPISLIVVDSNNNYKTAENVALSSKHLTLREEYFYCNVIAERNKESITRHGTNPDLNAVLRNSDGRLEWLFESDSYTKPIKTRIENDNEKHLRSVLFLYDYNLGFPKVYASQEGDFIYDIFKWNNKWIFVGSTTNKGYVDWENPYVVVLDKNLKVLSDSYLALRGERLTINQETIYERDGSLVIPEWVKINSDNTIEWFK